MGLLGRRLVGYVKDALEVQGHQQAWPLGADEVAHSVGDDPPAAVEVGSHPGDLVGIDIEDRQTSRPESRAELWEVDVPEGEGVIFGHVLTVLAGDGCAEPIAV